MRRFFILAVAAVLVTVFHYTPGSGTAFNGYYKIVNRNSGKVLQIQGAGTSNGAKTEQGTFNGANNQIWRVTDQGNGYYEISAKHSEKMLDVPNSTSNDVQLQQYGDNNTDAQRWQLVDLGGGYYKIVAKCSNKVMEVAGSATNDGASVQQYSWNGTNAQQWQIVPAYTEKFVGYYKIVSKYSGKVWDIEQSSLDNGAKLQQWTWNGSDTQQFRFVDLGTGYYHIYVKNSERAIDVPSSSTSDGAEMQQYEGNGTNAQQYSINDLGNGYFSIINRNSNKAMDLKVNLGSPSYDGTRIAQYGYNGNDKQLWKIEKVTEEPVIADGFYRLKAKHSSKYCDVSGSSQDNSANIIQYTNTGGDNQVFQVQYDRGDGTYLFTAKHSSKVIDVQGGDYDNGTDLIQYDRHDGTNQRFTITQVEAGWYKICCKKTGKCFDVTDGSTSNGKYVQQWKYTGVNQQRWAFEAVQFGQDGVTMIDSVCATQYPVLLLHGVALADATFGFNYFGRVPNVLRSHGAYIEGGGQDAWSSASDNGLQIRNKIEWMRAYYGKSKVNIIAHSKGGIDTRAMLRDYPETRAWVASFTTVASPMKGSALADVIFGIVPSWAIPYITNMINVIGRIVQGDDSPNSLEAGQQLIRATMTAFNNALASEDPLTAGRTGIYTQSYAAKIKGPVLDLALQATGIAMGLAGESGNDGAVWTESAPYGQFKGVIDGAWWCGGVTHFGIVDRGILIFPGFTPGFDAKQFYIDIVSDLKNRGY